MEPHVPPALSEENTPTASRPEAVWELAPAPPADVVGRLMEELKLPRAGAVLLAQRGATSRESAGRLFSKNTDDLLDPLAMKGMAEAVERLQQAHQGREKLMIYGDYDVDGTTAVALWSWALSRLNWPHCTWLPDRFTEGYGLSWQGVEAAVRQGCRLLLVLDCGVREVEKIAWARQQGLDVVVCDHHLPGAELPPATSLLNPKQPDCPYPFKELSGCGIGFKLLHAFCAAQNIAPEHLNPLDRTDLLALSIGSDLVPMLGENRILMDLGLMKINKDPLPGIAALMNALPQRSRWTVSDLVFYVGPCINAAGRLRHANLALDTLLAPHPEAATPQAQRLVALNLLRRQQEAQLVREAEAMAQKQLQQGRTSLVLHHPAWQKGLVGIAASKMVERHHLPSILLCQSGGVWTGSGRGVPGVDLYAALEACSPHLVQFGGHTHAAGLKLAPENLETFCAAFDAAVDAQWPPEDRRPRLVVDTELELDELEPRLLKLLARLEPFGPQHMRPHFFCRGLHIAYARTLKDEHLKLVLVKGQTHVEAIGFGLGKLLPELETWPAAAAIFCIGENHFNGQVTVQLELKGLRSDAHPLLPRPLPQPMAQQDV